MVISLRKIFLLLGLLGISCQGSEQLAREGLLLLDKGNFVVALARFDEVLKRESQNPLALFGKGKILAQEPVTYSLARHYLETAIRYPLELNLKKEAMVLLLQLALAEQDITRALQIYDIALSKELISVTLFLEAYRIPPQKNFKPAEVLLKGLLYFPQEIKLHLAYAEHLYLKEKKASAAAVYLQNLLEQGLQDEKILFTCAEYYYFDKNTEKAIALLSPLGTSYSDVVEQMKQGTYTRGVRGGATQ